MANHRAAGSPTTRLRRTSPGTHRLAPLSTGAVKMGVVGALATATIAFPITAATATGQQGMDSAGQEASVSSAQAPAVAVPEATAAPEDAAAANQGPDDANPASNSEGGESGEAAGDPAAQGDGLVVELPDPAVQDQIDASAGAAPGYTAPVEAPITSEYGMRTHPVTGEQKGHEGVDYGAACGAPAQSVQAGTVVEATNTSASGNRVKVDHGNGVITGYYHLQSFDVQEGDRVEQGDAVGEVGNTGQSTGCHLHFAKMDQSGAYSDPMSLFQ